MLRLPLPRVVTLLGLWQVQGFGTCCGYPVQGYNSSGVSAPNPASGGNAISSNGWLFSVCENDNCPVLDSYDPNYGIAVWFQQLWKVCSILHKDCSSCGWL